MTKTQFRAALEQLDLTQGQAAEAFHMTIKMVNNYATGKYPVPYLVEYWLNSELSRRRIVRSKRVD